MRVLFSIQPAHGHLNPMLGLSAALREAGHDVVYATSASFVSEVESRGERAVAAGIDWLESDSATHEPPEGRTSFEHLFLGDKAATMADDLLVLFDDWRPDLVVRESVEFGAAAAARRVGVPLATMDFAFPVDFAMMTGTGGFPDEKPLVQLQEHVGLPRGADPDWFRGDFVVTTLPDDYVAPATIPQPHVAIRPNVLAVRDAVAAPPWLDELDGAVYVSFGTVFAGTHADVLAAAGRGAARTGLPTVLTTGPSVDEELDGLDGVEGLRVEAYVPQGPLLDRCRAAVVHGGTGTTLGALARGVPLVVVPLGADQFAHARVVDRLGAGVVLGHEDLTAEAVTEAVRRVVDDPSHAEAARAIGERLRALPGPEVAVAALEDLVG